MDQQPEGGVDVDLAAKAFADAVDDLITERVYWDRHTSAVRREAGLYIRLRQQLTSKSQRLGSRAAAGSRVPASVAILSWLKEVDEGVAGWHGGGTVFALRVLQGASWSPADVEPRLVPWTRWLQRQIRAGVQLLPDAPTKTPIRRPCPLCGELFAHVRSGGESIRQFALWVHEGGFSECRACGREFEHPQILAAMLEQAAT